jgi:hypothetical protein
MRWADVGQVRTRWLRIALIVVFAAVALPYGYTKYHPGSAGGYPPAESLAGSMTPEWRDFANEVDHACARNYNAMLGAVDRVWDAADAAGWSDERAQSLEAHVESIHQTETYEDIVALGAPPARPQLFQRWLANVGRRAQLTEDVSRAWARSDKQAAWVGEYRMDGLKVDANWLGQHFGLRICTSNGPGRGPGEPNASYLEQVNEVCLHRNAREDDAASRNQLTPPTIFTFSRGETLQIAAIGPPTEQYPVRRQILATKTALDRYAGAQIRKAHQSPDFAQVWDRLAPSVERIADRTHIRLQQLGLPDCGNYGVAPAPSLLPPQG